MKKTMLLLSTAMLASLFPAPSALAAPEIAFVNPSSYTTPARISDVQDADGNVHLVAWASDIPSQALVEFELQAADGNALTFTADRVGADTWEAFFPIPDTLPDGATYTLRARLYSGVAGDADEVANDEIPVEINQSTVPPPRGETVEMTYPTNGSRLGIFVPKGKRPVTVFDFSASDATEQVRALYTLTDPGKDPAWEPCGGGVADDQGFGKARCTLKEGHNPLDVTAVGAVSNRTSPPAEPNAALDDTGDAHRVLPYLQQPSSVNVTEGNRMVDLSTCHIMRAFVTDQFGRSVTLANVDIHADGPEDELSFGSSGNNTDAFQAPDAGHVSRENAKLCSNNSNSGMQGDHNSPGRDDAKHIESTTGTSDSGAFRFALRSDFAGGTFIQAWADVDDDDLADVSEASGGTQIGWAVPPPEPTLEVFLTPASASGTNGSCVGFEITARRGGSPYNSGNVDIHLQGPEDSTGVGFCPVAGGTEPRSPESGGHLGPVHEDGTVHGEGETDAGGRLAFGVTSARSGTTQVQVWIDTTEDDLLSGERSASSTVTWAPAGERSISIASSRSRVPQGRRVRLSGEIDGDPACAGSQTVNIQAKQLSGGRFGTVKTIATDESGSYSTRIRMRASRKFRAVAPAAEPCSYARSNTVTVRVTR